MKDETIKTIGLTIFGCVLCIMFFSMFWAISLSKADVKTSHNITFNTDNETRDSLEYMSKIQEFKIRENDLYCDNELLNQSIMYEKKIAEMQLDFSYHISNLESYYQVSCRNDDGSFRMECFN